ncbi:GntR family transcriptional regulator [Mesorhizobium xinjiangense]|uniref:GntR family transcriptional regulator n=1 Tax=Mesorhizobium xinjiangense TaxID=2678685 RepID=UPI0012ECD70E|nr:GntR family transcriptional regulator [Mesorhizobium xinjiangense]
MTIPTDKPAEEDRIGAICSALHKAIIEQALKPGTKLPEDTLGERFGVSRTIARHALGQLAAEGLVELRRNRGAVVATPSWEEARDLFDMRISLERIVVSRLAGNLSRQRVAQLKAHLEKEKKAQGGSEAISIRLATEFHVLLAEMTGSPVLIRYVREVCLRCGLTLALYARPHSSDCAVSEHMELLDALVSGDAERAVRVMEDHLESVAERALIVPKQMQVESLMDVLEPYSTRIGNGARAARGKSARSR